MLDVLRVISEQGWVAWRWAVVGIVVGLILLWLGRRGRRVGEQPVCRKCGFDLRGKPAESMRCTECGADLTAKRAVAVGAHRRWDALVLAGGLVLGLSVGGLRGWRFYERDEIVRWVPLASLYDDYMLITTASDRAFAEIERRDAVRPLTSQELEPLMLRLAGEFERGAGLSFAKQQFMFAQMERDRVAPALQRRIMAANLDLRMDVPARARRNETMQIRTDVGLRYVSSDWRGFVTAMTPTWGGPQAGPEENFWSPHRPFFRHTTYAYLRVPRSLSPGEKSISRMVRAEVVLRKGAAPIVVARESSWRLEITNDPPVEAEFLTDAVAEAHVSRAIREAMIAPNEGKTALLLRSDGLNVRMVMDAAVRVNGEEVALGPVDIYPRRGHTWHVINLEPARPLPGGVCEVILRPARARAAALDTPRPRFYGNELVLRDVKVGPVDRSRFFATDPALVNAMASGVRGGVEVRDNKISVWVQPAALPRDVLARARVLVGGRVLTEQRTFFLDSLSSNTRYGISVDFPLPPEVSPDGPFDVELVPGDLIDELSATLTFWGEPIIVRNLPILRDRE